MKTFSDYFFFVKWLLYDSLWLRKWSGALVLVIGFLGVVFQVKVFAVIIYYASRFSTGELVTFAGYSADPRTSVELLIVGSVVVVFLLLLSSICIYFSRRGVLILGTIYDEYCGKRIFNLVARHREFFSEENEVAVGRSFLIRLIRGDSRLAGRVLRMLLSLFVPGLTFVVAVGAIFYLETMLTLLIGVLALAFAYCQYQASRGAACHSIQFEKLAPAAGRELKEMLNRLKDEPGAAENMDSVEQVYANGTVRKQLDAYVGRLRAVENSRLASGVFMALVLGLILLIMGGGIIREGSGWGRLLIYFVALRFAMVNLQNSFATITAINRFYPQVRRYMLFVQSLENYDGCGAPNLEAYERQVARFADSPAGRTNSTAGGLLDDELDDA